MSKNTSRLEWIVAGAAAVFSVCIIWIATWRYGPGISSDAVHYLSSAENLAKGKGLVNFMEGELVYWPPLYPALLGIVYRLTGFPLLTIGRFLNALSAGLIVLSSLVFFRRCFPQRSLWRILSLLVLATVLFVYTTGANVSTDLMFILLLILFFIFAQKYLEQPGTALLLAMAFISALAPLLRYVGLMVIPAGLFVIALAFKEQPRRMLLPGLVYLAVSVLPIGLWVVFHNYLPHGTLFGERPQSYVSIIENIQFTLAKINYWFLPNLLTDRLPAWLIWGLVTVILMAISRPKDWSAWLKSWFAPPLLPVWVFSLFYFAMITLSVVTLDHPVTDVFDDRYQSPLIFLVLAGLFLAIEYLVIAPRREQRRQIAQIAILVIFATWLVYPLYRIYKFTVLSWQNGVIAYNNYNDHVYQDTGIARFIKSYDFDDRMPIYSNEVEAFYILTGLTSKASPKDPVNHKPEQSYLETNYLFWPQEPQAYLVWFRNDELRQYYAPEQLSSLVEWQSLYSGRDGRVYLIKPRQGQ